MTAFAKITEAHDRILRHLTPCAEHLYRWLLRRVPAGRPVETFLDEFAEWSGYSLRHVQRSLHALLNTSLVEVVTRYSGRVYKLIAWHPYQDKTVPTSDQTVQSGTEMSQIEGSTPHSVVPKQQRAAYPTDSPHPHRPVDNEQGRHWNPPPTPPEGERSERQRQKLVVAEHAVSPQPLSAQLQITVLKYGLERLNNAVAALDEQRRKRCVKNPSGWLRRAIEQGWSPNRNPTQPAQQAAAGSHSQPSGSLSPAELEAFKTWFPLAKQAGIALASEQRHGEIYVYTDEGWEAFGYLSSVWPLQRLRELIE